MDEGVKEMDHLPVEYFMTGWLYPGRASIFSSLQFLDYSNRQNSTV